MFLCQVRKVNECVCVCVCVCVCACVCVCHGYRFSTHFYVRFAHGVHSRMGKTFNKIAEIYSPTVRRLNVVDTVTVGMIVWVNGWVSEWVNNWVNGRVNEWVSIQRWMSNFLDISWWELRFTILRHGSPLLIFFDLCFFASEDWTYFWGPGWLNELGVWIT
jgi:hypothetical protein